MKGNINVKILVYFLQFSVLLAVNFNAQWFLGPYLVSRGLLPKDIYLLMLFGTVVYVIGYFVGWFAKRQEVKSASTVEKRQ
jgi:hypothetical protein